MKARHAAALTLVGWHLMAPPGLKNYPLSQWIVGASFDSAAQCEHFAEYAREQSRAITKAQIRAWRAKKDDECRECTERVLHAEWREAITKKAVCIATDDPRLKEK